MCGSRERMGPALLILTTCLLGLATAATFFTKQVPEDPAHPGQCQDEVTRVWHGEHKTWKRGGECLQSFCSVTVGFLDSEDSLRHLEQISPGVFSRFREDPGKKPFSSESKNKTMKFKARGLEVEYLYVEGEELVKPQAFVSEQIITCFYHTNLPANCRETEVDNTLPFPGCCPKLACTGEPQGPIEAVG